MRRLLLHIGYAKCASTSLQAALSRAQSICYPLAGRHGTEHIALPLHIKGIDTWTRQFITPDWVEREYAALMAEIDASAGPLALSSERLLDLSDQEKGLLSALLPEWTIEIVAIRRPLEALLRSTWRHMVFRQDYSEPWEIFRERSRGFDIAAPIEAWRRHFPVHEIDMDEIGWQERIRSLFGEDVVLGHENRGESFVAAERLQQIHTEVGTDRFKQFFTPERKRAFSALYADDDVF